MIDFSEIAAGNFYAIPVQRMNGEKEVTFLEVIEIYYAGNGNIATDKYQGALVRYIGGCQMENVPLEIFRRAVRVHRVASKRVAKGRLLNDPIIGEWAFLLPEGQSWDNTPGGEIDTILELMTTIRGKGKYQAWSLANFIYIQGTRD